MAALGLACALAACAGGGGGGGSSGGGGGGGGGGGKCKPPATPMVSFVTNIQPIFSRSCAVGGCHDSATHSQNLDLSLGHAYAQVVGRRSLQQPTQVEVKPGDPNASYLYAKIVPLPGISGVKMPQDCPTPRNGQVCLTADDVNAISQWITECAPKK